MHRQSPRNSWGLNTDTRGDLLVSLYEKYNIPPTVYLFWFTQTPRYLEKFVA